MEISTGYDEFLLILGGGGMASPYDPPQIAYNMLKERVVSFDSQYKFILRLQFSSFVDRITHSLFSYAFEQPYRIKQGCSL